MHQVFGRFGKLASLTVSFNYDWDDSGRLGIDGAELSARDYMRREMREFRGILLGDKPSSFFRCTQESCQGHISQKMHNVGLKFVDQRPSWYYD